jgi:hypothetical protein
MICIHLHLYVAHTERTNQRSLETYQKAVLFRKSGRVGQKSICTLLRLQTVNATSSETVTPNYQGKKIQYLEVIGSFMGYFVVSLGSVSKLIIHFGFIEYDDDDDDDGGGDNNTNNNNRPRHHTLRYRSQ